MYLTIIVFHWLFLRAYAQIAEDSALSFMTGIPTLISNVRFVQENIINGNIEFNQTLPWIDFNYKFEVNQSNCSRDIQILNQDLRARKIWALKTLDAWGKLPSGIMQGNIYWVGSTYECRHHLHVLNNTIIEQPFRTRTCVINNSIFNLIQLIYGLCAPESCNASELVNYINQRAIHIPFISRYVHLKNDSIRCIDRRAYDAKAILTIVFLSLIAFLIIVASGLHVIYGRKRGNQLEVMPSSDQEILADRMATAADSSVTTEPETTTAINTALPADDESIPLIARPKATVDSVAEKLVGCCSLITNYQILKHPSQPPNLACLNGIRVLSIGWVIFGHTFLLAALYSDNVGKILNWTRYLWFQTVIQAVFSIDSFFLLSGLLTTFQFLVLKSENEKFSFIKFLLNHYVYRYLRYTIFYAIVLLIHIALSPYFGQNGPIYPLNGSETSKCHRTWWKNLLYINNFAQSQETCMPITWYVAVNMQLHWISPLFLLTVAWKWVIGMLVIVALILVDIISTSVIVSKNEYDHGMLSDFFDYNQTNTTHNYMNDVYIKPWCRVAPYAIGLAVGYVLYHLYQRSNTISWESILPQGRLVRYNRIRQGFLWILAFVILLLCMFGTYGDYNDRPLTRSGRITFLVLSRIGWSIGLSIIIVGCFRGHGGLINRFLGHRCFESFSKLTYGAYLWHSLVIFVNYFSRDQPNHFTMTNILFNFIGHLLISYVLAFVTFLFIELPTIRLLKSVFQRRTIA